MAGTLTFVHQSHRQVKTLRFNWLSDASGDVSGTDSVLISGHIHKVKFIPDSGGTQPSNLYDIVLNDKDGFDVLEDEGANLSNVTQTQVVPLIYNTAAVAGDGAEMIVDSVLSLIVSAAGDVKGGTLVLYYSLM